MPEHVGAMTDARLIELAEAGAEKALTKVFRRLRIKIDDDDEIDEFVDNQKFLSELRAGRKKLGEAASGAVWDLTKKGIGYILLFALVAAGASIGIHYPVAGAPPPALPPAMPPGLGPRP